MLEALGVNIMADPKKVEECVEKTGIGFMFAQLFNKSMRYVGQARSEMGIRTVFNILGPLANPSRAKNMVVGVYSPSLTEKVATAMSRLGVERAYVVSGEDKAETVKNAFFGPVTPQVPASILQLHNDLTVVADEAAMSVIKANHR